MTNSSNFPLYKWRDQNEIVLDGSPKESALTAYEQEIRAGKETLRAALANAAARNQSKGYAGGSIHDLLVTAPKTTLFGRLFRLETRTFTSVNAWGLPTIYVSKSRFVTLYIDAEGNTLVTSFSKHRKRAGTLEYLDVQALDCDPQGLTALVKCIDGLFL